MNRQKTKKNISDKYSLAHFQRPKLQGPSDKKSMVLHSCCAPCSGEVIEALKASDFTLQVFFYNPNIHPKTEYEIRKKENMRLCDQLHIDFYEADYDTENWFLRVEGLEWEAERGERCAKCFDMRFERTALYAHENGYTLFSSCLGISRWKNMQQINRAGYRAADRYQGLTYWDYNWRKQGGANRMIEIAKKYAMYQQEYCGCIYSLRDTNIWRRQQNRKSIRIGEKYYGYDQADALIAITDKNN